MPDGIIGSVGVSVVPDAQDFWRRFQEQTRAGAGRAGEQSGRDWRRGFQAANARPIDVRVNADTTRARAHVAALGSQSHGVFQKFVSAAVTLAPAIVPLGAAAVTAGAELVTMGAVGVLAIKGIKAEMDAGTPIGIEYAGVVRTLKGDLGELETTASQGVLDGFEQSVGRLQRELPGVNALVADQSRLLGDTVAHLSGGIAGGFQTFAPVLDDVAQSVDRIAAHFEAWATGPGGEKFADTLSKDYAAVAPVIDDIGHTIAHLVSASNGTGLVIVSELGLLARVLDSFPTPVLTGIVDAFVAFRTISAVQGVISGISGAFPILAARSTAAAASVTAANLQIEASAAAAAAEVATASAAEAASFAEAQAAIAAAAAASGSVLAEAAAATAAAATAEAAAFQLAAEAAVASAAEIGAAAEVAATESAAAGEAAAIGWSSMLGPAAIGVGLVALLGLSMLGTSDDTQEATQATQSYTAALKESNFAINDSVRAKIADRLSNEGAFAAARKFGISQQELVDAVTKGGAALDNVRAKTDRAKDGLGPFARLQIDAGAAAKDASSDYAKVTLAIDQETEYLAAATTAARDQEAALLGIGTSSDYAKRQISDGNTALRAYVDALDTFNKSADTAADRGKLIGSILGAANGDLISFSNTMVSAATANQQFVTDLKNSKDGVLDLKTGTLDYHNAAAGPLLADLDAIQKANMNAAAAVYQHELRTKGAKTAADDAFETYRKNTRPALLDEVTQLTGNATVAKKFVDQYFKLGNAKDLKKKIELVGEDKVVTALKGILEDLDILAGKATILGLQIARDNRAAADQVGTYGKSYAQASGGYISGPGTGTSDSIPARLSNGEYVVNAAQTSKHLGLLESINSGAQGFASGGFVGVDFSGDANKFGAVKGSKNDTVYVVGGQKYSSLQAAENAASRAFHAQVSLGLKIDGSDLSKFRASLKGTADQAHAAFLTMYNDAKKLGISDGLASALRAENTRLDREISARNKAADSLKSVQAKLADFRSTVSGAIRGSFDITTAGAGFDGAQPISGANILAQADQAAARARRFVKDVEKLQGKVSKTYLSQLAQKGPDALPEAEALLTLNDAQLRTLQADNLSLTASGQGLGSAIGNSLFGADISKYKTQVAMDNRTIDSLASKIGKQVETAVATLIARPIYVQVDGRTIARATASGTAANARRS